MKFLTLLLSVIFLAACKSKPDFQYKYDTSFTYDKDTLSVLQSHKIDFNELLGSPTEVEVIGNHLIVFDDASPKTVLVYDLDNNQITMTFGKKGNGPTEFRDVESLDKDPRYDNVLWAYDFTLKRLARLDFNLILHGDIKKGISLINLKGIGIGMNLHFIDDSTLISTGFYTQGRFGIIDIHSKEKPVFTYTGAIEGPAEYSNFIKQRILQSRADISPGRTSYVVAARYSDKIEIVSTKDFSKTVISGPENFNPDFSIRESTRAINKHTRFGYISVDVSKNRIFALYSGRKFSNPYKGSGSYLNIFDWQGKLLNAYKVDKNLMRITYSKERGELYGIQLMPEVHIVKYSVK